MNKRMPNWVYMMPSIYYCFKHRTPSEEQYLIQQLRDLDDSTFKIGRNMLQYLDSLSHSQLINNRDYRILDWRTWESDEYYHSDFAAFIAREFKLMSDYNLNYLANKLLSTEEYGEEYGVKTVQQTFNFLKQLQNYYDPDEIDPTFFEITFKSDFHNYLLTS